MFLELKCNVYHGNQLLKKGVSMLLTETFQLPPTHTHTLTYYQYSEATEEVSCLSTQVWETQDLVGP